MPPEQRSDPLEEQHCKSQLAPHLEAACAAAHPEKRSIADKPSPREKIGVLQTEKES